MLSTRHAVLSIFALQSLLSACSGTITGEDATPDRADDRGDTGGGGDSTEPGDEETEPGVEPTLLQFTSSDDIFLNPERGFYEDIDLIEDRDYSDVRRDGRTLGFDRVDLDDFRTTPLTPAFLDDFEGGLVAAREAGIKVVLRFSYSSSLPGVDASKDLILTHIAQLEPIIQEHSDVIAVWQAGFIGAWGEWHSSSNDLTNPQDEADILLAMLDALPASRMLQIRTPKKKVDSIGAPMAEEEAFSAEAAARIGHHNDCFLASDSDFGTYPSNDIAMWKNVVAQDGRFAPIGGETCAVNAPRSSCDSATQEMRQMHWSFINANYNLDVLGSWESEGCMGDVQRELGYRLSLESASVQTEAAPGGVLDLELHIDNSGYASLYNPRPVHIVLEGESGRYELPLDGVDARSWEPGVDHQVQARLRLPADLAEGSYRLALRLPDEAPALQDRVEYAVRLANEGVWDDATGDNVLTEDLWISADVPGPVDAGATEFAQL